MSSGTLGRGSVARPRRTGRTWGRLLGLALVLLGLLLVLYWASDFLVAGWRQSGDEASWRQLVAGTPGQGGGVDARPANGIDFRLRVPKLGYTAVVREGVDLGVLATGPGHYPESAWPGQQGNVGVAAHNAFWIQFDQLHPGDDLVVETRYGSYHYQVTGTRIVSPDDRTVLQPAPDRQLTLTTCWPLWAGELARQRLTIFARSAT